jgi:methylenetetrahydrofolate reductase (NADH)
VSNLKDALDKGEFVISGEIGPPKGTDIAEMKEHIELLKDKVHALNVTDNQTSVMRITSLAVCKLILEAGGEPVLQLTCRDRNRLALQGELLSADILGIENVLCLTGDYISAGDHPQARPVFDLDSVQLLQATLGLNNGKDMAGNDLKGSTHLIPGAVVTPEADPIEPQLIKFAKKVEAGAQFFQTQAVYDMENFKRFMDHANKLGARIMCGLVLLTSPMMVKYMNTQVPGVFIPDNLVEEMASVWKGKKAKTKEEKKQRTADRLSKGIEIMGRQIRQIKEEQLCAGVHIMAIGKEAVVPRILEAGGLA